MGMYGYVCGYVCGYVTREAVVQSRRAARCSLMMARLDLASFHERSQKDVSVSCAVCDGCVFCAELGFGFCWPCGARLHRTQETQTHETGR